jgi:RHS repeat-associated protein
VNYTYDANGNRATLQIPGYSFTYNYTWRDQLRTIVDNVSGATLATYAYDENGYVGDLTSRTLNNNTHSVYTYDALDRVTWVLHYLNGTGRTFQYGYETDGNNRLWAKRLITPTSPEGNKGEVFDYDLNDQAIAVKLNVLNPDTTAAGNPTIIYDANGNRTWFVPPGWNEQYAVANNLNQYTSRTTPNGTTYAAYDTKGSLTTGLDGSAYTYDAQNRLTRAIKSGVTETFTYDGLNRQVSRTVGAVGGTTTYSVWEGWNLVQEYRTGPTVTASYLYGATGLVKNLLTNNYYYQDGSGSTSHLANSGGALLEWYRYDLDGTPFFYNSSDQMIGGSNAGVRHLFTGQQWYSELGLYDLRNRFYSPDIGRFLQPDPIGFRGDRTNLYRHCGNNPVTRWDPSGLQAPVAIDGNGPGAEVIVRGEEVPPTDNPTITGILEGIPSFGGPSGSPFGGFGPLESIGGRRFELIAFKNVGNHSGNGQHQSSPLSAPPPQNPPPPAVASSASGPGSSAPTAGVFTVIASEFAGGSDYPLRSAYGPYDAQGRGPIINPNQPGASLPFRFPSNNAPPGITVGIRNPQSGLSTSAPILDVGPWNLGNNFWGTGAAPLAESQFAAHSRGQNGQIVTNPAGIDLTPATMDAIGATGPVNSRQVQVMWWFLTDH